MERKIKATLRRYFRELLGNTSPKLTPVQRKVIYTVKTIINSPSAKLSVAPRSGVCFVEEGTTYIEFSTTYVLIKNNGSFSHYTDLDYKMGDRLVNFFYDRVEEHRSRLKAKHDSDTLKGLENILKGRVR